MTTDVKKIKQNGYKHNEEVIIPPVDIYETEHEFVITTDMPGVTKENIDITLNENKLEISGSADENECSEENLKYREYQLCNYNRTFTVGENIDNEKIRASMDHGVLTVHLPKKEEVKPKKIPIAVE